VVSRSKTSEKQPLCFRVIRSTVHRPNICVDSSSSSFIYSA